MKLYVALAVLATLCSLSNCQVQSLENQVPEESLCARCKTVVLKLQENDILAQLDWDTSVLDELEICTTLNYCEESGLDERRRGGRGRGGGGRKKGRRGGRRKGRGGKGRRRGGHHGHGGGHHGHGGGHHGHLHIHGG